MGEVALAKSHEKADAPHTRDMFRERLELFVVEKVHIPLPDPFKRITAFDFHRRGLNETTVFKVAAIRRDFTDINLGVEIRGERIPVVAAVAVQNVDLIDRVEFMLQRVS